MGAYLGLDVSKADLAANLIWEDSQTARASFMNSPAGHRKLCRWLGKHVPLSDVHAVLEATNVYWEAPSHALFEQGVKLSVVNPARVKFFARSQLRRGKTDQLDAEIIAQFAQVMQPQPWHPPDEKLQQLKLLIRERDDLVKSRTQERNRLHVHHRRATLPKALVSLARQRLRLLDKQVKQLENSMRELLETSGQAVNLMVLLSLPGVGLITASTLIAETYGLAVFVHPKQLAAYVGIAPAPFQSGAFAAKARISKLGNPRLRRVLYLAAVAAVKTDSPLRDFYQRLLAKGKPKKVALIAVARKLLTLAFTLVKTQQPYDPEFQSRAPQ